MLLDLPSETIKAIEWADISKSEMEELLKNHLQIIYLKQLEGEPMSSIFRSKNEEVNRLSKKSSELICTKILPKIKQAFLDELDKLHCFDESGKLCGWTYAIISELPEEFKGYAKLYCCITNKRLFRMFVAISIATEPALSPLPFVYFEEEFVNGTSRGKRYLMQADGTFRTKRGKRLSLNDVVQEVIQELKYFRTEEECNRLCKEKDDWNGNLRQ